MSVKNKRSRFHDLWRRRILQYRNPDSDRYGKQYHNDQPIDRGGDFKKVYWVIYPANESYQENDINTNLITEPLQ